MPPLHSVSSDYKALLCPLPITQSQPATKQSQPTERDSGSIIHQYTRKGLSRDTMDQEYNYFVRVQLILPLIGSLVVVCGMGLTIHFLKPDKAVRIMFPHINKHGNNTVMFGFILKKEYTHALFAIMLVNVFFTALVFWIHLVIDRSRKYNPFGDYKCFYSSNHIEVNISLEEALTFDEDVECFSWTLNIGGAVGQATGTLLFAWVLVSVVTWIILNAAYKVTEFIKDKSLWWKILGWISLGILQGVVYTPPLALVGVGIYFFDNRDISLLSFFDLLFFSLVLIFSSSVLWWHTEKEPKSVEDCCSELIEAMAEEKDSKDKKISLNITKRKRNHRQIDNYVHPQHPDLDPDERTYELDEQALRNRENQLQRDEENGNPTDDESHETELCKERIEIDKERIRLKEERIRIDKEKLTRDKNNFEAENDENDLHVGGREIKKLSLDIREMALKEKEVQLARYKLLQKLAASEFQRLYAEEAATHMDKKDILEISKVAFAQFTIQQLCPRPSTTPPGPPPTDQIVSTESAGQAPINDGTPTNSAITNTRSSTQETVDLSLTPINNTTGPIVNDNTPQPNAGTSSDTNTTGSSINGATINNNTPTSITSPSLTESHTSTQHTINISASPSATTTNAAQPYATPVTQPVTDSQVSIAEASITHTIVNNNTPQPNAQSSDTESIQSATITNAAQPGHTCTCPITDPQVLIALAPITHTVVNSNTPQSNAGTCISIDTESSINDATINNNTPTSVTTLPEPIHPITDNTSTHSTINTDQSDNTIICTHTETTQPVTINSNTTTPPHTSTTCTSESRV